MGNITGSFTIFGCRACFLCYVVLPRIHWARVSTRLWSGTVSPSVALLRVKTEGRRHFRGAAVGSGGSNFFELILLPCNRIWRCPNRHGSWTHNTSNFIPNLNFLSGSHSIKNRLLLANGGMLVVHTLDRKARCEVSCASDNQPRRHGMIA